MHLLSEKRNNIETIENGRLYSLQFIGLPTFLPDEKIIFIDEAGFNVSMRKIDICIHISQDA